MNSKVKFPSLGTLGLLLVLLGITSCGSLRPAHVQEREPARRTRQPVKKRPAPRTPSPELVIHEPPPSTTATRTPRPAEPATTSRSPRTVHNAPMYDYVVRYKSIAMETMRRDGIPASITLAQGILESNAGRSELAQSSNNHFGIKCGNDWSGPSYYKKDDDRRNGKLIKSCFRKYGHPEQSFKDHADFLTDPRKRHRYGTLFNLSQTDYKGWAHGLREAGYATHREYAERLIDVIERYGLMDYDQQALIPGAPAIEVATAPATPQATHYIEYIVTPGDTLYRIAQRHEMTVAEIQRMNSLRDGTIHPGQRLRLRAR